MRSWDLFLSQSSGLLGDPMITREQICFNSKNLFLPFLRQLYANSYIFTRHSSLVGSHDSYMGQQLSLKDAQPQFANIYIYIYVPLYWLVFYIGSVYNQCHRHIFLIHR